MELNKETIKKLRGLILFTALLVVAFVNYRAVFQMIGFGLDVIFPFILGGAMAFIINAPMQFFERHIFGTAKAKNKKWARKLARPVSLLISLISIIAVLLLVIFVVAPELGNTFARLGKTASNFIPTVEQWLTEISQGNDTLEAWIMSIDFNWNSIVSSVAGFLHSGAQDLLDSTFSIAKSVISGVTTFFIAFVFACYIILQKEKLETQIKKAFYALLPGKAVRQILKVSILSYRTFLNFLTGQCVEAVILGTMFFVAMSILKFPYALLVGILIAFTALIPIFGAFIGCAIGAFLILMENPIQALFFILLFLVLQQVEGNLIYPHVVGGSVGLPSIWVLVAVSLGGSLMGIAGMILFIPGISVAYSLFREYVYKRLKEKNITIT